MRLTAAPRDHRDFLELSPPVVVEEEIRLHVVADEKVGVAVVVVVGRDHSHVAAGAGGDARGAADVGERAVAVVAVQGARARRVLLGRRIDADPVPGPRHVCRQVEFQVVARVQVRRTLPSMSRKQAPAPTFFVRSPPAVVPATPARAVTSVNVPSPLLRYKMLGPKLLRIGGRRAGRRRHSPPRRFPDRTPYRPRRLARSRHGTAIRRGSYRGRAAAALHGLPPATRRRWENKCQSGRRRRNRTWPGRADIASAMSCRPLDPSKCSNAIPDDAVTSTSRTGKAAASSFSQSGRPATAGPSSIARPAPCRPPGCHGQLVPRAGGRLRRGGTAPAGEDAVFPTEGGANAGRHATPSPAQPLRRGGKEWIGPRFLIRPVILNGPKRTPLQSR